MGVAVASPISQSLTLKLVPDPAVVRAVGYERLEVPKRVRDGMRRAAVVGRLGRRPKTNLAALLNVWKSEAELLVDVNFCGAGRKVQGKR
jgi:hypothetical protein